MKARDYPDCPTLSISHLLGKKWVIPVIEEVYFSKHVTFGSVLENIRGITKANANNILKDLHREGFLEKKTYSTNGRKHADYRLSGRGLELRGLILDIKKIGRELSTNNTVPGCGDIKCSDCPRFSPRV